MLEVQNYKTSGERLFVKGENYCQEAQLNTDHAPKVVASGHVLAKALAFISASHFPVKFATPFFKPSKPKPRQDRAAFSSELLPIMSLVT